MEKYGGWLSNIVVTGVIGEARPIILVFYAMHEASLLRRHLHVAFGHTNKMAFIGYARTTWRGCCSHLRNRTRVLHVECWHIAYGITPLDIRRMSLFIAIYAIVITTTH